MTLFGNPPPTKWPRRLGRQQGGPIEVEDDQTQTVYLLVERHAFDKLVETSLRQALQIGLDQADRGESEPWDVDAFLTEAHQRHAQQA